MTSRYFKKVEVYTVYYNIEYPVALDIVGYLSDLFDANDVAFKDISSNLIEVKIVLGKDDLNKICEKIEKSIKKIIKEIIDEE